MKTNCESCKKSFTLTSPEDIVECRTVNDDEKEIAPREWILMCPKCQKKYAVVPE